MVRLGLVVALLGCGACSNSSAGAQADMTAGGATDMALSTAGSDGGGGSPATDMAGMSKTCHDFLGCVSTCTPATCIATCRAPLRSSSVAILKPYIECTGNSIGCFPAACSAWDDPAIVCTNCEYQGVRATNMPATRCPNEYQACNNDQ
jgi:hypothetical protein